jgi:hypothetical protein
VDDIRSNSWSKPSSLKDVRFYVNISNKDRVTISDPNARSHINVITDELNVVIDDELKYIINIYEENHFYVIVSDIVEDSELFDTTNGYQLSKPNRDACKLVSIISSNARTNLFRSITFIQPYDNILIIFEAPSNLYLSKLPAVGRLVIEGSGSVSFVGQNDDSNFSLQLYSLKQ